MNKTSFTDRMKSIGLQLWKMIKHVLFHNGWVKLLAVVISLMLWAGLISQDDSLTRDKTWQNVNVTVSGTDTMKRNGYIVVSNLDELLSGINVTAAVPQKVFDLAEPSFYNVRVDLSRINGTGKQELKILSTSSSTYGKVTNTVPSAVNVEVEEYFVRQRIPVSVTMLGDEYQSGWYRNWYMPSPSVDPMLIALNGPRSLVQTILRAKVLLDPDTIEWKEGVMQTTGEIKLYNRAGEEVSSPLLSITTESLSIDTALIDGNILPTQAYNTKDMFEINGQPQIGYRVSSVKFSPETVRVAARSEVLEQLDELTADGNISIKGLKETKNFQVKIQKPSEDAVLSNETVTVTVEIEPDI